MTICEHLVAPPDAELVDLTLGLLNGHGGDVCYIHFITIQIVQIVQSFKMTV